MTMLSDEQVIDLLRTRVPATPATPLPNDMWPRVRDKIDGRFTRPPLSDVALVLALAVLCLLHPALIGVLLLHV